MTRSERTPRRPARLTPEQILDAIRRWDRLYGEPPSMADWDPYRARQLNQEWRIERYDAGDWPSVKTVRNHFGRLSDAVAAAGLVPRTWGQQTQRIELALDDDTLLHLAHLKTLRDGVPPQQGLGAALRAVAAARASEEPGDLRCALVELAAAALSWARVADLSCSPRRQAPCPRASPAARRSGLTERGVPG